ncbi:hypothetical protein RQ479_07965 [Mesorhizobium sp. ISC25]|uniref:hypothetical protein n=1 Tax=Mesorhizobium sp. ISC25 TaxID=3077335 RepID=UPI0035E2114F
MTLALPRRFAPKSMPAFVGTRRVLRNPPPAEFNPLLSVVTETSTTPTTARIRLGRQRTGIRIWAGEQAVSETHFFVYVSRNGGAPKKLKLYRWSGRILTGAPGDEFAFGTADGRTLIMSVMNPPTTLETSFPVTGTANADQAGPPFWSPPAAHVILASPDSAFKLVDDGTSKIVFIKERDPASGQWSPTRFVRTQAGRDTAVRCTYREIALATYTGSTLSIAAADGPKVAMIGGTKTVMHNPFMLTATGTTRNVTDVATFKAAMAAAVAGDEIVLAAGTYALDIPVIDSTFAANDATARVGMEGILIRGATGVAADVTITGNGIGTNGNWEVHGGTGLYSCMKDLTYSVAGVTGIQMLLRSGKWALENVPRIGNLSETTKDLFAFDCSGWALELYDFWGSAQSAGGDVLNGNGDLGGGTNYLSSRVIFVGMNATIPGAVFQDQCLTTHGALAVEAYGGVYSDANLNAIAPDDLSISPIYAFFVTGEKRTRAAGMICHAFGCTWDDSNNYSSVGNAFFNYMLPTGLASTATILRNCTGTIEHNYLVSASGTGRAFFDSNNTGINTGVACNIMVNFNEGVRWNNSSGAGGTSKSFNNTLIRPGTGGIAIGADDLNMLMEIKGNATKGWGTGLSCSAASMAHLTTDFNVIDPTVNGNFVKGANDIITADAQLDAFFFPTAGGNCDGNDDPTRIDYIGDSDPWGYVRVYKSGRVSRGARDIPAIYAGADLHPDLF